ncbi:hypothetical protein EVAR_58532_1 [Eumeta japonica]|uniref:Uncharacterized protein n=1 Tax=Eumeta variegata TaxID=151549 RepID=A0A4C1Z1M2_EUMVA|nr:hypothetical protein EVAR_58532_1 [Eumeta japonica]
MRFDKTDAAAGCGPHASPFGRRSFFAHHHSTPPRRAILTAFPFRILALELVLCLIKESDDIRVWNGKDEKRRMSLRIHITNDGRLAEE